MSDAPTSTPAPAARSYSAFWPFLIFLAAVSWMNFQQTAWLHRQKLSRMQQYTETVKLKKTVLEKTEWITQMRTDLVRLAPSHPEAARIVTDLHLTP